MRRVALVTGARGFIGAAAAAALEKRSWRVIRVARSQADLSDAAAVRRLIAGTRPHAVVHAAGATAGAWRELWDANVGSTVNLLEGVLALSQPSAVRVVIAGSAAEYGDACGRRPARESGPCSPLTLYGATKLSQTLAALSYRHRGLDVAVARVFNTCGPGAPEHLVPGAFARQLAAGSPRIETGDLAPSRDFVDVRDVGEALALLAAAKSSDGIYNVCSGRAAKIADVLAALVRISGRRVRIQRDVARGRRVDLPFIVGDGAKLRRATGWKPRFSLERSLRDSLDATPRA